MLEGLYSDIYMLSMLVGPELMNNLKPSEWHTWEKSICAMKNLIMLDLIFQSPNAYGFVS